jgi:hypothetical protein
VWRDCSHGSRQASGPKRSATYVYLDLFPSPYIYGKLMAGLCREVQACEATQQVSQRLASPSLSTFIHRRLRSSERNSKTITTVAHMVTTPPAMVRCGAFEIECSHRWSFQGTGFVHLHRLRLEAEAPCTYSVEVLIDLQGDVPRQRWGVRRLFEVAGGAGRCCRSGQPSDLASADVCPSSHCGSKADRGAHD